MRWEDRASCSGRDVSIFFEIYEDNKKIRRVVDDICKECPVQRQCFASGVSLKSWGTWGGIYLEDGEVSKEFNDHKTKDDWQEMWTRLTHG